MTLALALSTALLAAASVAALTWALTLRDRLSRLRLDHDHWRSIALAQGDGQQSVRVIGGLRWSPRVIDGGRGVA